VFEESTGGRSEQYRNLSLKDSARRIDTVLAAESHLVRLDTSKDPKDSIADIGTAQTKLAAAQKEMQDAKTDADKKKATQDLQDAQNALKDAVTVAEEVLGDKKKALAIAKKALAAAMSGGNVNDIKAAQDAVNAAQDAVKAAQAALEDAMDAMQSSDGIDLVENDFTGPGLEDAKSGLYALKLVPLFNILCIPPYKLGTDGYDVDPDLISTAAAYCEIRRAMLLVDPPSAWKDKNEAKGNGIDTGVAAVGTNSKNAALYFPRLRQPNPLHNNQFEEFVPCGVIAGIWSRTDSQRGVWKAPAGLDATMVGVPLLTVPLNDAENGELNPLGINCLRAFPAAGRVVWGARTLQGDDRLASEWKYVPIRRLALFIEESLFRGTQWVVFEPNDEPLWAQIRLNVGAFMQDLFRKGAFQGSTAREAYFVKCDKETTTQNDRDHGIVNIIVGFAPLKPAEFVIIALQQMAGQIQV
jgi:Bacteriophage tail sheath protein